MSEYELELLDRRIRNLAFQRSFHVGDRIMELACLIRDADQRPLDAPWWRGKQVYLIGVDLSGNFLLRHSGGAVLYWDHQVQKQTIIAPSVKAFLEHIKETMTGNLVPMPQNPQKETQD